MTDTEDLTRHDAVLLSLVAMFQDAGMRQLGKLAHPLTGKPERDLDSARATIEVLEMLQAKCRANTPAAVMRGLDTAIFELRMNWLDESKRAPEGPADPPASAAAAEATPRRRRPRGSVLVSRARRRAALPFLLRAAGGDRGARAADPAGDGSVGERPHGDALPSRRRHPAARRRAAARLRRRIVRHRVSTAGLRAVRGEPARSAAASGIRPAAGHAADVRRDAPQLDRSGGAAARERWRDGGRAARSDARPALAVPRAGLGRHGPADAAHRGAGRRHGGGADGHPGGRGGGAAPLARLGVSGTAAAPGRRPALESRCRTRPGGRRRPLPALAAGVPGRAAGWRRRRQ